MTVVQDTALDPEVNLELIELGNVLVLFFAGLSVDLDTFQQYWSVIVVVGSGYAVFITVIASVLAQARARSAHHLCRAVAGRATGIKCKAYDTAHLSDRA